MTPQTIVIMGAGIKGQRLATALSASADRVLLCDADPESAADFVARLRQSFPLYNLEAVSCYYEAAWEADVIVLSLPRALQVELAAKVKPVACQKVVITTENNGAELQDALPHSKIVEAFSDLEAEPFGLPDGPGSEMACPVAGRDEGAVKAVMALVSKAGYRPVRQEAA